MSSYVRKAVAEFQSSQKAKDTRLKAKKAHVPELTALVKTAEEKAREAAEEEERRKAEEEQKRKEEEEEREAKAKKGPSLTSKLMKWLGTFTEPDE